MNRLLTFLLSLLAATQASAQAIPQQMRIIVPYAAGGSSTCAMSSFAPESRANELA